MKYESYRTNYVQQMIWKDTDMASTIPEFICSFAKITIFGDMTLRSDPTGISALEKRGK
jgi:hypothetical protein